MDKVVHFEITADDMARAKHFYHTAFGWHTEDFPEMKYTIVTTSPLNDKQMHLEKGAINGGIMQKNAQVSHPVITIESHNMAQSTQKVKDAGGHILVEPTKVGEMGISAYFKDTEGNVLGLWQTTKKE